MNDSFRKSQTTKNFEKVGEHIVNSGPYSNRNINKGEKIKEIKTNVSIECDSLQRFQKELEDVVSTKNKKNNKENKVYLVRPKKKNRNQMKAEKLQQEVQDLKKILREKETDSIQQRFSKLLAEIEQSKKQKNLPENTIIVQKPNPFLLQNQSTLPSNFQNPQLQLMNPHNQFYASFFPTNSQIPITLETSQLQPDQTFQQQPIPNTLPPQTIPQNISEQMNNQQINQYSQNPYTQNPYIQNPYQQNPYQQNPYQQNPYQQNPYALNPYFNPYLMFERSHRHRHHHCHGNHQNNCNCHNQNNHPNNNNFKNNKKQKKRDNSSSDSSESSRKKRKEKRKKKKKEKRQSSSSQQVPQKKKQPSKKYNAPDIFKRDKARNRLRKIFFAVTYTVFIRSESHKLANARRVGLKKFCHQKFDSQMNNMRNWLLNSFKYSLSIVLEKKHLNFNYFQETSKKVRNEKQVFVIKVLHVGISKLLDETTPQKISLFTQILYNFCFRGSYSYNRFWTAFEMEQFCISQFYGFIRADETMEKWMIGVMIFLKLFVFNMLLQPHKFDSKNFPKNQEPLYSNMKVISSVFYHMVKQVVQEYRTTNRDTAVHQPGNWLQVKKEYIMQCCQPLIVGRAVPEQGDYISGLHTYQQIQSIKQIENWGKCQEKLQQIIQKIHVEMCNKAKLCRKNLKYKLYH